MTVSFTSRLTPRSYYRLLLAAGLRPATLGLLALAALVSAAYVFWVFAGTCGGVRVATVFAAVTFAIVPAFVALLVLAVGALQVFLGRNRNLYVPVEITADEEGVRTSSPMGEGLSRWAAFVRIRRVGPYVLLYQTSRTFFALGGADVEPASLDALELLAREHVRRA